MAEVEEAWGQLEAQNGDLSCMDALVSIKLFFEMQVLLGGWWCRHALNRLHACILTSADASGAAKWGMRGCHNLHWVAHAAWPTASGVLQTNLSVLFLNLYAL